MTATLRSGAELGGFPPRHICFVTETYPPEVNGVAFTLAHLVDGLAARGPVVSVVRPRQRTSKDMDDCGAAAVTLVPSLPFPWYRELQVGIPAGRLLRHRWQQRRPDVVYVATQGPLGWSAARTARHMGIPVFSGFHTNFDSYSKHYGAGWLQPVIMRCLRRFHNCTWGALAPCRDIRERLQASGFQNIHVLDRGVDSQLFTPARRCAMLRASWGVSERGLAVLSVGRIAVEKNLQVAVAAYCAMQRIDPFMKCVVVGDGPYRAAFEREHADLIFCGIRVGEDLAQHYASAAIFLFPSEMETFGNVTLEAMASGLVMVAYDYAAAHVHMSAGKSGVLVPYGASEAFVDAAVKLVQAPQSMPRMRQQARAHAGSIAWTHVVEQFETLLLGALARRHAAPAPKAVHRGVAF